MKILVTGAAGFIGSNFVYYELETHPEDEIVALVQGMTNKEIADWAEMMGDPVLTTALLDRILQHASCFSVKGESYRLKHPHVFPAPLKKKRGSWQVQGKKKLILPREECCTW